MKRGQLLFVLLAVVAVGAVALLAGGGGDDGGGGGDGDTGARGDAKPAANAVRVSFAYSPEKEKLLVPLVRDFNAERRKVGGRPVFVEATIVSSGEAQTKIARGSLMPVAWSPASSLWGRLLNFEADRQLAPMESPSIVRTPLVIAMWEPMARALGHPRRKIGFADILRLARSDRGWAGVGRPEFGPFKYVHTNPDFSTSGLSATVAEYYAATGKKEGLKESEVNASRARTVVRDIERSIVHYGDTTLYVAEQLRKEGPAYASAVAMEEVTLLDFNRTRRGRDKLIALYPEEGTFYSDNPFIVLDAPWVTAEQEEGAKAFQRYLAEKVTPEVAARSSFRPADLDADPAAPITSANGVDPRQPTRILGLPEPRVLDAIRKAWRADRKPANILVVLDTSGSMAQERRLERAQAGLQLFLRQIGPQDSVGLTTFSDRIQPLLPIRPFRQARAALSAAVDRLIPDGGTAFYDATAEAFANVRALNARDRINAVVLLTDGEDTDSSLSPEEVLGRLRAQGDSANRVRLYTIAYSTGATGAREKLEAFAAATGGRSYEGSTDDIETVYRSISSFF